jgi:hypothetical protein
MLISHSEVNVLYKTGVEKGRGVPFGVVELF